jgi:DMSO/TMAO reductase YedYZ molybdopterin-dependent catalytic subunit
VTGYRWSLPIEEARDALLATHVGREAISHGHGFPLRVVTPGRRGFQWVKWVDSVEVRERYDYGQWVVIFTSGFSGRG